MDFRHRWYWSKQGAQNINWADYLIVAACVSSAGLGFWRGFVKEVFGFVALLIAIWLLGLDPRRHQLVEPAHKIA